MKSLYKKNKVKEKKIICNRCGKNKIVDIDSITAGVFFNKNDNPIGWYGYHNCEDGELGYFIDMNNQNTKPNNLQIKALIK